MTHNYLNNRAHEYYLRLALDAAKQREGFCAPNPAVGAVVVRDDVLVSTGTHWAAGFPHAEVDALEKAGDYAKNATLYVTLEPCCHVGKTPPCTDAIQLAGIKEVIYAVRDPNPVARCGADVLKKAGIPCRQVELPEINEFYKHYCYWLVHKKPFVSIKLAFSADYKIAGENGMPIQLTGPECHELTHQNRLRADALLTTAQTVVCDNPFLTVRLADQHVSKPIFVLDSELRVKKDTNIFNATNEIIFYHKNNRQGRHDNRTVAVDFDEAGLNLQTVLKDIGSRGIHHLWVEVGAKAFYQFCHQKLAQEIYLYRSPKIVGEKGTAIDLSRCNIQENSLNWRVFGGDRVARYKID